MAEQMKSLSRGNPTERIQLWFNVGSCVTAGAGGRKPPEIKPVGLDGWWTAVLITAS